LPDDLFMRQVVRTLTDGSVGPHPVLLCDRDTKWSAPVRSRPGEAGIRVVQTPYWAPNANAYVKRFVRSIKGVSESGDPDRRPPSPPDDR
jgi:hypothetical protein